MTQPEAEQKLLWIEISKTLEDSRKWFESKKKQDLERQQNLARWAAFFAEVEALDETRPRCGAAMMDYPSSWPSTLGGYRATRC